MEFGNLLLAARKRKKSAFKSGTVKNHLTQFRIYLGFCKLFQRPAFCPDQDTVLAYIEFLCLSFTSAASVVNYLSGVKTLHNMLGLSSQNLNSYQTKLMLRAVKLTLVPVTNLKQPVTVGILISLCKLCDALEDVGKVFKCLFCLAFFSLLRQSNLLVSKGARDNQLIVLRRCEVVVAHPGLRLLLRGTKTLLARGRHGFVPVPVIPDSQICPVAALSDMLCVLPPAPPSAPLF